MEGYTVHPELTMTTGKIAEEIENERIDFEMLGMTWKSTLAALQTNGLLEQDGRTKESKALEQWQALLEGVTAVRDDFKALTPMYKMLDDKLAMMDRTALDDLRKTVEAARERNAVLERQGKQLAKVNSKTEDIRKRQEGMKKCMSNKSNFCDRRSFAIFLLVLSILANGALVAAILRRSDVF